MGELTALLAEIERFKNSCRIVLFCVQKSCIHNEFPVTESFRNENRETLRHISFSVICIRTVWHLYHEGIQRVI